jgi:MFS family permease
MQETGTASQPVAGRPDSAVGGAGRGWRQVAQTFVALGYREFRLLWLGQLCQSSAGWAERVSRSWLALQLTGSAFQLGTLELTRGVAAFLLGMWGGVLADRFDKRRLLLFVQTWTLGCYALMAWLTLSGQLQLWHLYASAIALSLSSAVNQPVRSAYVASLVPEAVLVNAMALNSIATNATRMAAPISVAALIQVTGNGGWGYVLCAGLFLLVELFTRLIRVVEVRVAPRRSLAGSLWEGWSFIGRNRPILIQFVVGFGPLTIGFVYQAMLVVYATGTLGQGAAAYGALYSAAGFGALLGGLRTAALGTSVQRGRLLLTAGCLNGIAILGMGALGLLPPGALVFWLAIPLLMVAGGSQTSFRAANNGLMLAQTPRELRGRVMSLDEGFRNVGTILAPAIGALADATSAATAMTVIGAGSLLVVLSVWAWQPHIRKL